jgi:LAS superfamily LD-carboxypeptidase LdcB
VRIVEPNHFNQIKPIKKKRFKLVFLPVIALVLIASFLYLQYKTDKPLAVQNSQQEITNEASQDVGAVEDNTVIDTVKDTLIVFSDNEYKIFYDNLLLPNLLKVENPPVISGNDIADARIRKIAEDRGYRLRSSPSVELKTVEGYLLQEQIASSWKSLKAEAAAKGLNMSIVSGYRSVEDQRNLFLQRLSATGVSIESVASGKSDKEVDKVLVTTSIPGYSKHHTGYTIDILCSGYAFENFKNSPCNDWMIADNYAVAKENGFIPSYPPAADAQGPNPEAWEYVWVGTDLLYE